MGCRLPVLALLSFALGFGGSCARAADGDPDPAFSSDGRTIAEWAGQARGARIAVAPSGVLYVGATVQNSSTGTGDNFAVAKYTRNGVLMTSFGFLGYRSFDFGVAGGSMNDELVDLFPLADGRVLLAGSVPGEAGGGRRPALVMMTADGSLDLTFGNAGIRRYADAPWPLATLRTIVAARQADGRIVLAGTCEACPGGSVEDVFLLRVGADGAPDTGFGESGWKLLGSPNDDVEVAALTFDPLGRIALAGHVTGNVDLAWLARLLPDGNRDTGFGQGGWSWINPQPAIPAGVWKPSALLANPDSSLVFAMNWNNSGATRSVLMRRTPGGAHDATFGGGVVELTRDDGSEVHALARRSDGKVVAAGQVTSAAAGTDFFVARLHGSGALDNTFDSNGVVRIDMEDADHGVQAMLLDAGRPLMVGRIWGSDPTRIGMLRLQSDLVFADRFE